MNKEAFHSHVLCLLRFIHCNMILTHYIFLLSLSDRQLPALAYPYFQQEAHVVGAVGEPPPPWVSPVLVN